MVGCHNHLHTVFEEKSFGNETLCPSRHDHEHDDSEWNKKKSRFKRDAPGCGGLNSKSGGMVKGARDSTANSSGNVGSSPIAFLKSVHPAISAAPVRPRAITAVRPQAGR
jgi:hypothetical protein